MNHKTAKEAIDELLNDEEACEDCFSPRDQFLDGTPYEGLCTTCGKEAFEADEADRQIQAMKEGDL